MNNKAMDKIISQSPRFRYAKITQAALLILMCVLYLCYLMNNHGVTTIFTNILFTLCFLVQAVFLVLDFFVFYNSIKESDEIKQSIYLDDLSGIPNRSSCDLLFQTYSDPSDIQNVGCALIVIGNLFTINQSKNRKAGNQMIADFCQILDDLCTETGFIGRNGGNEFLFLERNCTKEQMKSFLHSLDRRIQRYNELDLNDRIEIYYKYVLNSELKATKFSDIITEVYRRLHTSPSKRYN